MAREFADLVQDTATTTGTGPWTMANVPAGGFQPFGAVHTIGATFEYTARAGSQAEVGTGTLTAANKISRAPHDGVLVNFTAPPTVFEAVLSRTMSKLAAPDAPAVAGVADPAGTSALVEAGGVFQRVPVITIGDLTTAPTILDTYVTELFDPATGTNFKATIAALRAIFGGSTGTPADTAPPVLTSASGTATGTTTATGTVTTNEGNGTLYCLASTSSAVSAATAKTGITQAVTSAGAKTFSLTGLTASTLYFLHFLHRDAAGNDSDVATTSSFMTSAPGDTTAPVLSLPTGTQTGSTTASGSVSTNEANGTLYRLASVNATETAATIKAANLTSAVTATGVQNVSFTGLAAATQYYAHYVHRDAAGNDSAVANSAAFTTAAASTASPFTVDTPTTQKAGVEFSLTGTYTGTVTAMDYSWDGGATWQLPRTATVGSGAFSLLVYVNAENASQVLKVRNRATPADQGTTAAFAVTAPTAYTIVGYGTPPNGIRDTLDASDANKSNTTDYTPLRQFTNAKFSTATANQQYWSINASVGGAQPASCYFGWGDSPTVPPPMLPVSGSGSNAGASNSKNGFVLMTKATAFGNNSALWITIGDNSKKYPWYKPSDGVAVCFVPAGMTIINA